MAAIKTISKDELSDALENGETIQVLNVLPREQYHLGMIQDSQRIPLSELEARIDELDINQEVVTYCSGGASPICRQAAEKLAKHGYKVRVLEGGIKDWKEANLPTDAYEDLDVDDSPDAASGLSGLPNSGRS